MKTRTKNSLILCGMCLGLSLLTKLNLKMLDENFDRQVRGSLTEERVDKHINTRFGLNYTEITVQRGKDFISFYDIGSDGSLDRVEFERGVHRPWYSPFFEPASKTVIDFQDKSLPTKVYTQLEEEYGHYKNFNQKRRW